MQGRVRTWISEKSFGFVGIEGGPARHSHAQSQIAESRWSWAWHPTLQSGHVSEGYNTHHCIRATRPEYYDGEVLPFHGWAVIRGKALKINLSTLQARIEDKTVEIGVYPDSGAFEFANWDEVAQLIADRIGLSGHSVVRLPNSRPPT
jgi:hypothetical protein